jgi:ribosomal protein S18 acetylase RimI-like enzyme
MHLLSGVTIEEVSAEDTLTEWIKPVRESFPSADNAEQFRLLNAHLPHGPGTQFRHFVLLQKKVAITSVTLFVTTDAVMIHNLATKPIYRRQGLATLIMIYALREAQRLGIQHCFLDSSSSGYHLYAELGFEVCAISKAYTSLK